MSLNWKEIALILEEEPLAGCRIQAVTQNAFSALTWELYSREKGRFLYYTEVGTPYARLHTVPDGKAPAKMKKLQRFIQFARKHIEGSVIKRVEQLPYDRCVVWHIARGFGEEHEERRIYIRLYSGPGANIIVTDVEDRILDLLLRRPNREEISGNVLKIEKRTHEEGDYQVREHEGRFNDYITRNYADASNETEVQKLTEEALRLRTRELERISRAISRCRETLEKNSEYNRNKDLADLLSANMHGIVPNSEQITVNDWSTGSDISIPLDRALSPSENVQRLYSLYEKQKNAHRNAGEETERLEALYRDTESRFDRALISSGDAQADVRRLKALIEKTNSPVRQSSGSGLRLESHGFELLVGRNAAENDELLRHHAKSQDTWMHTRDWPGGFVFIRFKKGKTIPLEVLLDAANLAVLYSKGRNDTSVSLYYTQVRHLRRARDGKKGLVLPTQEKNLTIKPDKERLRALFGGHLEV